MGALPSDTATSINSSMLNAEQAQWARGEEADEDSLRALSQAHIEAMLNNWTTHINDPAYDLTRKPAWRGLLMALYVTVILVGLIGNSIVVFVVCRNRQMQNVTNIFIANLAVSDILLCAGLPVQVHYELTNDWVMGETMCRLMFTAWGVPLYGSIFTILLIAFDRYWLIVYPLRDRMSRQTALILIALNFMVCFVLSLPVAIYARLQVVSDDELDIYRRYCTEVWPSPLARRLYGIFQFLFQFCLPLLIAGLLYSRIYRRLQKRPTQRVIHHERKQKTNKILGAIVMLFTICWLPWCLHTLLMEIETHIVKGHHFKFVDMLLKVFAMTSACINPFLYCWLNENFRKELDSMAIRLRIYREPSLARSRRRHNLPQFHIQPMMEDNGQMNGEPIAPDSHFLGADGGGPCSSRTSTTRLSTSRISASNIMEIEASNALEIEHTIVHEPGPDNAVAITPMTTTIASSACKLSNHSHVKAPPVYGNTLLVPVLPLSASMRTSGKQHSWL